MRRFKGLDCILLIDDEEINNYLNRIIIKKAKIDAHVQIALNGLEAIDYLRCIGKYANIKEYPKPGLILLDINMPRMNGWEFLQEYEKLSEEQKGKIVIAILTSSNNPDDIRRADEVDSLVGYFNKPLNKQRLEDILENNFVEE